MAVTRGTPSLQPGRPAYSSARLLSTTKAALPSNQWTPVWSEAVAFRYQGPLSVALSNVIPTGGPQQFFRLRAECGLPVKQMSG
jgi:hypothetical protein